MTDFGPFQIPDGECWEIQGVCTGAGGVVVFTESFFVCNNAQTGGNLALGLDAPVLRTVAEGGGVDLTSFTCSDGTPIDEWEVSFDLGQTWMGGFTPATIGTINFDCTLWRFRCGDDWSDDALTIDIESATNNYENTTIQIEEGTNPFTSICMPCGTGTQLWQYRIDYAEADETHPDGPNTVPGDRPDADPADPNPDSEWQALDGYPGCRDCVTFQPLEVWPDGVEPDGQGGETFVFYLRVSCDNGETWMPEISVTLET